MNRSLPILVKLKLCWIPRCLKHGWINTDISSGLKVILVVDKQSDNDEGLVAKVNSC